MTRQANEEDVLIVLAHVFVPLHMSTESTPLAQLP